jgi:carbamoyl-phosphate synthase large subunit
MKILVTGVAGDIGNGIGRILKGHDFVEKLIGCDIHGEHMGRYIFDRCEIVPSASAAGYLDTLRELTEVAQLDAVVVTSEPELRFFNNLESQGVPSRLPLVMANHRSMTIGFDKLKTAEFVAELGMPAPWTRCVSNQDPVSLPCILKSRYGAGNQGVYIVKDTKLVGTFKTLFPDFIWQEYMPDDNNEYTCGVYGCSNGDVRTIIFRRRLVSGVTGYAELVQNQAIDSLCTTVARALGLWGSINIQLRLTERGPIIFEINPRFSSTVVFRHKMGFTDLLWSLQEQILGEKTTYQLSHPVGTKLYRAFDEVIGI